MKITLEMDKLSGLQSLLVAGNANVQKAGTRAIKSTLLYIQGLVKKDAAAELNVPQKALTKRMFISNIKNGDQQGRFWAGTWNVSPFVFGPPIQASQGVFDARGMQYAGAFIKRIFGYENIWIRLRSKFYDPNLYPGHRNKPATNTLPRELNSKFPVAKASIEIIDAIEKVFRQDEENIRYEFDKRLRAEVNFALNVEGRK
jgi:hypothetical protein